MAVSHLLALVLMALYCCSSAYYAKEATTKSQLSGSPVECISCDWISSDMTKTLFELSHYVQYYFKDPAQILPEISRMLKKSILDRSWETLLHELDQFSLKPRCDLERVGKLTALEARLEEGEELNAPHETKILSLYLEQLHLQHLQTCRQEVEKKSADWKSDASLQETRKTFVQFAEQLKEDLANYKTQHSKGLSSLWFTGIAAAGHDESNKAKPEFEHGTDLLNRGKTIISREHLFEKVRPTSGRFFGPNQATCRETLNKHVVQMEKLSRLLEPIKWLANYNPQSFVHVGNMSEKDKKERKLLSLMPREQEKFLKSNKEVADWLALQGFLKRTFRRQEELCSALQQ